MVEITGLITFALSTGSAAATVYLWTVKWRQERPNLKVYPVDPSIGGRAVRSCGDPIKLVLDVKAIVANASALPNAVLGMRAWVKKRDGSWQEAEVMADPKTPLPLNIPAVQTVRLDLSAKVALPAVPEGESCRNTNETFALYRQLYLADPIEVKVELEALGDCSFTDVLASRRAAA
jgi:hypothetical protein